MLDGYYPKRSPFLSGYGIYDFNLHVKPRCTCNNIIYQRNMTISIVVADFECTNMHEVLHMILTVLFPIHYVLGKLESLLSSPQSLIPVR